MYGISKFPQHHASPPQESGGDANNAGDGAGWAAGLEKCLTNAEHGDNFGAFLSAL